MMKNKKKVFKITIIVFLFIVFTTVLWQTYKNSDVYKAVMAEKKFVEIQDEKERDLSALFDSNGDMIFYLEVPDTNISYPVMQTKDNPDFYLTHDFDGNYSFYGTPYLDYRCDGKSTNLIIYGHDINGRRMFGELLNYKDKDYFTGHEIIYLYTRKKTMKYKIAAVVNGTGTDGWYGFINAADTEEYAARLTTMVNRSVYDCGHKADDNTGQRQILTLSTCGASGGNTRFFVIAIKINGNQ